MQIWKDFCKQAVTSTTGSPTTAFTLGSAPSGFQALASGDNGGTGFFAATEGSTWQTFFGTYTHSGTSLAVTSFIASSSGSALSFTSAAVVKLDVVSQCAQAMLRGSQATTPGGRLTLTSGTSVTTSDVTGATTIYYTPHVSDTISLWDGNMWSPTVFTEVTKALGTLTNAQTYDVFGFLSSGALDIEFLAWTNSTTRATAITLQDGRYCKSGNKTRLYLGTFYTDSTTTTSDATLTRYLHNAYNQVVRVCKTGTQGSQSHTYGTGAWREWNGGTSVVRLQFVLGLPQAVRYGLIADMVCASGGGEANAGIGIDSTSADPVESLGPSYAGAAGVAGSRIYMSKFLAPSGVTPIGYHFATPVEYSSASTNTCRVYWLDLDFLG